MAAALLSDQGCRRYAAASVVLSARRGAKEGRPSGWAINMNRNREIGRPRPSVPRSDCGRSVGGWESQPSLVPAVAKKEEKGTHAYDVRTEEGVGVSQNDFKMTVS